MYIDDWQPNTDPISEELKGWFSFLLFIVLVILIGFGLHLAFGSDSPHTSQCSADPALCERQHEDYENLPMGG